MDTSIFRNQDARVRSHSATANWMSCVPILIFQQRSILKCLSHVTTIADAPTDKELMLQYDGDTSINDEETENEISCIVMSSDAISAIDVMHQYLVQCDNSPGSLFLLMTESKNFFENNVLKTI